MFYNRDEELSALRKRFKGLKNGELIIIYGRRRVGKTELARKLLEGTDGVYLYIDFCESSALLDLVSKDITSQTNELIGLRDWEMFFQWISRRRGVVVMDEFQRFLSVSPEAITRCQKWWDTTLKHKPLMLILAGSSVGMMRKVAMSLQG